VALSNIDRNFIFYARIVTGINAGGIRKLLKIPSRYAIPVIVSTGLPYSDKKEHIPSLLDENSRIRMDDRYNMDELIFGDFFGAALPALNT
jgi:hypothetical protein